MAEKKLKGIGKAMRKLKGPPWGEGPDGKLTEEQLKFVADWFKERLGEPAPACPMCGTKTDDHWILPPLMVMLATSKNLFTGAPMYPNVSLICTNCGHTLLFNAVAIGLVEPLPGEEG